MELSKEEKAILAHVVRDPDSWFAHAMSTIGESAVIAKIDKYRKDYLTAKDQPGYQTAKEREDKEFASMLPTQEQIDFAAAEKLIRDRMRKMAITELQKEGKLTAEGKLAK
jgi:hypothetical protein